jgi:trk system potassium uptake protein TrkA
MRIVIVGGGVVGASLAEHLLKDGHDLSLIELDENLSQSVAARLDLQVITGSGSSPSILRTAGIENAELLLAVTPNNEVNLVACSIAAQYNVATRIARLRGGEFSELSQNGGLDLQRLGVTSVIHPEKVLVDQIMQYVETPHAVESANFEDGAILLKGFRITDNMPIAHKSTKQIRKDTGAQALFAAIVRFGQGVIPDGETVIKPGDILYTLFPRSGSEKFLELVNIEKQQDKKIIITGDSYSTVELGLALDNSENNITLVDPNLKHAREIAGLFKNIETLHGDATKDTLLREINVDKASFFIAVSDEADYNMLSALLAKSIGAEEVIAMSSEWQHDALFRSIGIDHVVNPRLTTARVILEIISRGQIGAVVKLSDVDIEAARFTVDPASKVAGKKVRDVGLKMSKGAIIGVIVRDGRMILPDGDSTILANDHIIIISHHENLDAARKLFTSGGLFGLK